MASPQLILDQDYQQSLKNAKPTVLPKQIILPPPGTLGAPVILPEKIIPPINTNIQFNILPSYDVSKESPGLASIDVATLPESFNWKDNGGKKTKNLALPGNQMLCGSCWAISGAEIVADTFVISGIVDWKPRLSTTWCLSCFPQGKCQGGNPAILFEDISKHGIATENCIDYSWCSENPLCNGESTKHFEGGESVNLSTLVPGCGCYDAKIPHYLYFIDKNPKFIAINQDGITETTLVSTVKKHVYTTGPAMGGFLVFENFRSGAFTKTSENGGVYLENGIYDDPSGKIRFDTSQTTAAKYVGSHAVAIIGWGVQKNIVIDNQGTRADVPYWYCRNSWTENWGSNGYFKMAIYPHNKISQFDRLVTIFAKGVNFGSGGIVLVKVSQKPRKVTLKQLENKYKSLKKKRPDSFYSNEAEMPENGAIIEDETKGFRLMTKKSLLIIFMITFLIIILIIVIRKRRGNI